MMTQTHTHTHDQAKDGTPNRTKSNERATTKESKEGQRVTTTNAHGTGKKLREHKKKQTIVDNPNKMKTARLNHVDR